MLHKKLALTIAATLFAIPQLSEAAKEVTLWHAYRSKEKVALEKVVANFNKSQSDIKLKAMVVPYDAFADKITAAIPRGKGPDLFIFAQDRLGDWAASELIEPVDFWVNDELRKQFLKPTLDAMIYDDSVYGLPMAFKSVALFYNADLVKAPPKDTNAMIALAKKLTDAKAGKYGLVYENANFYYQAAWMQGFGGRVFGKKGKPTLATKATIDSMKFAQRLAHKEGIMPEEIGATLVSTLFNSGKAAMVINGPWFTGEINKKVKYKVAVLPTISENGKPARPFLTAEGLIMSAKAKDKKAAFAAMKYLTSAAAAKIMAKEGRQPVARADAYNDPKIAKDPILSVFRKQLSNSVPMPNTPAMRMVWGDATTAMNKIINGKKAPEGAMKEAQKSISQLVKGARR